MLTYMHAIRSWTLIRKHKLFLLSHNLLIKSILLVVPLMIEREKRGGKGKEVGVVVLVEVATMIIKGVASMMKARDLLDTAKGARTIVIMGVRVTAIREARIMANHPTSLPSLIIRINNKGTASNTIIKIETRVELTVGMETVEVVTVVLGVDLVRSVTGVMGFLITYMEQATGRPSALLNLSARSVVDLT